MNEHSFEEKTPITNISTTERLVSAAAGIWFAGCAFQHRKKVSISSAATAGFLLYRAITGHCPIYSAMDKNKESRVIGNVNIRSSVFINGSADRVYEEWRSARILKEYPGEYIGWRSLPGAHLEEIGKAVFIKEGANTTRLDTIISYRSMGGLLGKIMLKALQPLIHLITRAEIRGFKKYIERHTKDTIAEEHKHM